MEIINIDGVEYNFHESIRKCIREEHLHNIINIDGKRCYRFNIRIPSNKDYTTMAHLIELVCMDLGYELLSSTRIMSNDNVYLKVTVK